MYHQRAYQSRSEWLTMLTIQSTINTHYTGLAWGIMDTSYPQLSRHQRFVSRLEVQTFKADIIVNLAPRRSIISLGSVHETSDRSATQDIYVSATESDHQR